MFSLGCDTLGKKLARRGYDVTVTSPTLSYFAAMRIRNEYLHSPHTGPIVIMGHSMGGRLCMHLSRILKADGIPVRLVVIADSNPHVTVPENVERCVNLFVTNPLHIFHGAPVERKSCHTQLVNADMTRVQRPDWAKPVNHFNIDANEWVHQPESA